MNFKNLKRKRKKDRKNRLRDKKNPEKICSIKTLKNSEFMKAFD